METHTQETGHSLYVASKCLVGLNDLARVRARNVMQMAEKLTTRC